MRHARGFTLIELVIYVGLVGVLISSVMALFAVIQTSRIKQQSIAEVEQQGSLAMGQILQVVRNGTVVTTPATSTSATSLTVTTFVSATSPMVIDLSSSTLRIKEGTGSAIALTNTQVIASDLLVQNMSRATTSGSVRVQFTLSYATTSGTYITNYAKTFVGSATVRRLQQ